MIAVIYGQYSGYHQTQDAFSVTVSTPPPVPSSISVSPASTSSGSHTASWGASSGATKYILEQKKDSGSWVQKYSGTSRSKALSGLTIGSYTYRVKACKTVGSSEVCSAYRISSVASITAPPAPSTFNVPAAVNIGQPVPLSWSSVSGATVYGIIRYDLQNPSLPPALVYNGTGTSVADYDTTNLYNFGGLLPPGSYGYTLVAFTASGSSSPASGVTQIVTPPPTPSSITVPTSTNYSGSYTVSWGSASGATDYELQQQIGSGSWTDSPVGNTTSKAFSSVAVGGYKYRVRACKVVGSLNTCSSWRTSGAFSVAKPSTPGTFTVPTSDNNGAYTVSWSASTGATRYELWRRTNGGSWSRIHNDNGRSEAQSGLGNASYEYRVRACSGAGCSGYTSIKKTDVAITPGVPSSISNPATSYTGSYTVSWGTATGSITKYDLNKRLNGGTWSSGYDGTATSKAFSSQAVGSHQYAVRACKTTGSYTSCSAWRYSSNTVVTAPTAPSAPNAPTNDNNGAYSVAWSSVSGAAHYDLQRQTNGGSWTTIADNTTSTSRSESGLGSAIYGYRVRACSTAGCSAYSSVDTTQVAIKPGVPSSISTPASNYTGSHTVSWGAASGSVTSYDLNKRINGGSWSSAYNGLNLSKAYTGLSAGTYEYQVRACKTTGSYTSCSAYVESGVATVSLPPTPSGFTAPEGTLVGQPIILNWGAVSGATFTLFRYDLVNTGMPPVVIYNGTSTAAQDYDITNAYNYGGVLPPGAYGYELVATTAVGSSSSAFAQVIVVLPPGTPASITVPSSNYSGSYDVNWSSVSGATDYELQQQIGSGTWTDSPVGNVTSKSFNGIATGSYKYRVRACTVIGSFTSCSSWRTSSTLTVSKPTTPTNFTVPASDDDGSFTVTWSASTGASSYTLQRRVNGGSWSNVALSPVNATSKAETVTSGVYEYQVRANSGSGSSAYTTVKKVDVAIAPGVPASISAPTSSYTSHTINWGASSGSVTRYELEQQKDGGNWTQVYSDSARTELLENLELGTYLYRVRACNVVGSNTTCSSFRTAANATVVNPDPLPVPSFATVEGVLQVPSFNSIESISLSWNSVEGATWYNVEHSKDGGSWILTTLQDSQGNVGTDIPTTSGSHLTFDGLPTGQYRYRVRACNANVCSEYSDPSQTLNVIRVPTPPSVVVDQSAGVTTVIWHITGGSSGDYEVELQPSGGSFAPVSFDAQNRTAVLGSLAEGSYTVRVRTCVTAFGEQACTRYDEESFDVLPNQPPIAVNDTVSVQIGTPIVINVLGNDSDPEGSVLTISSVTQPANGSVAITGAAVTFTPDAAFIGATSFSYTVSDDRGDTGTANVAVSVLSALPLELSSEERAQMPVVSQSDIDDTDVTGTLQGEFSVNASGAATYKVPIMTAPGSGGLAPQLSLQYSSQAGNGPLGIGWGIGGLSQITRARQTLQQDGEFKKVNLNNEDRFSLDGQRLILVSGQYGADGSEYRTEIDRFIKITAHGQRGNGPDYFTAKYRDGSIVTYGGAGNHNSEIVLGSSDQILTWSVNTRQDTSGNLLDYLYVGSNDTGHRINRINYAFSDNSNLNSYRAYVEFNYENEDRSDPIRVRVADLYSMTITKRLSNIVSYGSKDSSGAFSELRNYQIEYMSDNDSVNDLTRLTSISECLGEDCLPATTFDWRQHERNSYTLSHEFDFHVDEVANYKSTARSHEFADINGDGLRDIVWIQEYGGFANGTYRSKSLNYAISGPNGWSSVTVLERHNLDQIGAEAAEFQLRVADYNADGRFDVFLYCDSEWKVFLSEPQQNGEWALSTDEDFVNLSLPNNPDILFADFNTDGLSDAVWHSQGASQHEARVSIAYLQKDPSEGISSPKFYYFGNVENVDIPLGSFVYGSDSFTFESFDDTDFDGRPEIVYSMVGSNLRRGGTLFNPINVQYFYRIYQRLFIDENRRELIGLYDNGSQLDLPPGHPAPLGVHVGSVFQPDGTVEQYTYWNLPYESYIDLLGDINGDGSLDNIKVAPLVGGDPNFTGPTSYQLIAHFSDDEEQVLDSNGSAEWFSDHRYRLADVNEDGYQDLVSYRKGSSDLKVNYFNKELGKFDSSITFNNQLSGVSLSEDEFVERQFQDMNADGINDFVYFHPRGKGEIYLSTPQDIETDKVYKITNGLGSVTDVTYETLSNTDHYSRLEAGNSQQDKDSFYSALNGPWALLNSLQSLGKDVNGDGIQDPVLELKEGVYVVTDVSMSSPTDDASNQRTKSYYYSEAKLQAMGRGFLGFESQRVVDHDADISTTNWYRQDFPFVGRPERTEVRRYSDNLLLNRTDNIWQLKIWNWNDGNEHIEWSGSVPQVGQGLYYPYLHRSTLDTFSLAGGADINAGDLITRQVTENTLDGFGNTVQSIVTTTDESGGIGQGDSFSVTTTLTFDNRLDEPDANFSNDALARWRSLPSRKTVKFERLFLARADSENTDLETTLTTAMGYNSEGLLATRVLAENLAGLNVTTTNTYNSYGQEESITVTESVASGGTSRSNSNEYEQLGRFLREKENALGHKITITDRDGLGRPTESLDVNNVSTSIRYTDFGHQYLQYRADGSFTISTRSKSNLSSLCPTGSAYYSKVLTAGGGESIVCYDILEREVRTANKSFSGEWSKVDTIYDEIGRVKRKSEPYISNNPVYTVFEYDTLDRVTSVVEPGRGETKTEYYGLTTAVTTAPTKNFSSGLTKIELRNALGDIVGITDHSGGQIHYDYDALGNMSYMKSEGYVTKIVHDELGRKIRMEDPDKGTWSYTYNGFNELKTETDGKGQITEIEYDLLGRMINRFDRSHGGAIVGSATWDYDEDDDSQGSVGNLVARSYINGSNAYQQVLEYDQYGRSIIKATVLDNNNSRMYTENIYYDAYSRQKYITDAANDPVGGVEGLGFASALGQQGIENHYNSYGYLSQITSTQRNSDGTPFEIYQTIDEMDARNNVVRTAFGNGLWTTRDYEPNTGRLSHINTHTSSASLGNRQDLTYVWDNVGNLDYREQVLPGNSTTLRESFNYDGLNRLVDYRVNGGTPITVRYDNFGNIENKSDVSSSNYLYAASLLDCIQN
ncbi:Ig-like domain-containing protein [Porticoccus sp. GXU_MW_L64]